MHVIVVAFIFLFNFNRQWYNLEKTYSVRLENLYLMTFNFLPHIQWHTPWICLLIWYAKTLTILPMLYRGCFTLILYLHILSDEQQDHDSVVIVVLPKPHKCTACTLAVLVESLGFSTLMLIIVLVLSLISGSLAASNRYMMFNILEMPQPTMN